MAERIVIVGGNAAGMAVAGRARRLRPDLDITILEMSHFIAYSICGLPYFTFGLVKDHEDLVSFTPDRLAAERDIRARTQIRVDQIQAGRKSLLCTDLVNGRPETVPYDQLVLCTGYRPRIPNVDGIGLDNVFTTAQLEDGLRLRHQITRHGLRRVAVVGGGYVGLMMACGLRKMGLSVKLFERRSHVYPAVDDEIAESLESLLTAAGVELYLKARVREIKGTESVSKILVGDSSHAVDLVLIDIGVDPRSELALEAGISCGLSGGVRVDARGQASLTGVYAAGNCAETTHLVSGQPISSRLGTTAARQGRVVGENLAGLKTQFPGTLETSVEQLFEVGVARTGLSKRQALRAGFEATSVHVSHRDRAGYLPSSEPMEVIVVYDKMTHRLLGGQLIGRDMVPKRIDVLATAITAGMRLEDLAQLDLAYAPSYGTLWDPVQIAANLALRDARP